MKVLFLLYLVCVSFESMRDYAGFGYASLDLVMYPMNLCGIMRDLVMPRCCFVGFGYASLLFRWIRLCFDVFVVSVMFL